MAYDMIILALDDSVTSRFELTAPFLVPTTVQALVHNACDAGATQIFVRLDKDIFDTIEVQDNGSGIEREDLDVIAKLHCTSRISALKDLRYSRSFGFRGRDLATILDQAFSVEMTTRCRDSEIPSKLLLEDKQRRFCVSGARNPGTLVKIDRLLNHREISKDSQSRSQHTSHQTIEILKALALARPNLKLTLSRGTKDLWNQEEIPALDTLTFINYCHDDYSFQLFLARPGRKGFNEPVIVVDGRPLSTSEPTGKMFIDLYCACTCEPKMSSVLGGIEDGASEQSS